MLGSDTIQLTGLQSIAVGTVATAVGPVKVIELRAAASTITGLTLQGPCTGHVRVSSAASRETATGGLAIDATAIQATILGIPIVIAAADLPEGAITLPGISLPPLPTDLGLVTVSLFTLSIRSGLMAFTDLRITDAAC